MRSLQLAREDPHKLVLEPLVLAEHVANLARAHSNVSSWHISVGPCITQALRIEAMIQGLQAEVMSSQSQGFLVHISQMYSSQPHMMVRSRGITA